LPQEKAGALKKRGPQKGGGVFSMKKRNLKRTDTETGPRGSSEQPSHKKAGLPHKKGPGGCSPGGKGGGGGKGPVSATTASKRTKEDQGEKGSPGHSKKKTTTNYEGEKKIRKGPARTYPKKKKRSGGRGVVLRNHERDGKKEKAGELRN